MASLEGVLYGAGPCPFVSASILRVAPARAAPVLGLNAELTPRPGSELGYLFADTRRLCGAILAQRLVVLAGSPFLKGGDERGALAPGPGGPAGRAAALGPGVASFMPSSNGPATSKPPYLSIRIVPVNPPSRTPPSGGMEWPTSSRILRRS